MTGFLNNKNQTRFNQLVALFTTGDISDEQEAELITLRRELQQNKKARAESLTSIKKQVTELNIAIAEIYSKDEITTAAKVFSFTPTPPAKKPASANVVKKPRASDSNEVLMVLRNEPREKGPSEWSYRQGRVYERASGTTSQPWAMRPKQFPSKLLKIGYSSDLLRPFFTPPGVAYFATEQGQAELSRLVEVTIEARLAAKVAA